MPSVPRFPSGEFREVMNARSLERFVAIAGAMLVLNAAWLWAFADASLWYYVNVALHPLLGLTVAFALARHAWRRTLAPPLHGLTAAGLAAGLFTGLAVLVVGAVRPHYRLVAVHAG